MPKPHFDQPGLDQARGRFALPVGHHDVTAGAAMDAEVSHHGNFLAGERAAFQCRQLRLALLRLQYDEARRSRPQRPLRGRPAEDAWRGDALAGHAAPRAWSAAMARSVARMASAMLVQLSAASGASATSNSISMKCAAARSRAAFGSSV